MRTDPTAVSMTHHEPSRSGILGPQPVSAGKTLNKSNLVDANTPARGRPCIVRTFDPCTVCPVH